MTHVLQDLLRPGLRLVVCGTAASSKSASVRRYYAGPGNKFWRILAQVGLTPEELTPADYRRLPDYGIGLTDIAKSQSGGDDQITFQQSQREVLQRKIQKYQPRYLCFNGKRAAKEYFAVADIQFGLHNSTIGLTRIFVAPSTSGAANGTWDPAVWRSLATRVRVTDAAT